MQRCYLLQTIRGSHIIEEEGVPMEKAHHRLKSTEPKLTVWQQCFCYHSAESLKKTFENTSQYYKSVAYENQLFLTHSFQRRFPALKVKWLNEDVCTDSIQLKVPRAQGIGYVKFMGQLFVTQKSCLVQVYCLPTWTKSSSSM
jgi:hypothetical protein